MKPSTPARILRQPDVITRTGSSKSTLYEFIQKRQLQVPIKLGACAVGFLENDVDEIMAERTKESRPYREQGAQ